MKLLVMGATKGIGRRVVDEALARGHRVRAMARSADTLPGDVEELEPFPGDALDPDDVRRALEGVDVVVQALGIRESVAMLWEEVTLFSRATAVLLPAMEEQGVSRLVAVTGFGAGDSRRAMSLLERAGHRAVLGKPYADKDRQEAMIEASDLDWTILRPTILTKGERTGRARVLDDPRDWRNGLISRADVAVCALDEIEQRTHPRRAVVLTR
jgi:putative NADH-flavin reductase